MEQTLALAIIASLLSISTVTMAQQKDASTTSIDFSMQSSFEEIPLYDGKAPGSENWNWSERRSSKNSMNVMTVYNVSQPTLTVFKPEAQKANGSAVVVCPGGGFHFLAIDHEGTNAANELVKSGFTVFVLKYRTLRIQGDNPFDDMINAQDPEAWDAEAVPVIPLAVADGRKAIEYLRKHASKYGVKEDRIGIMGFSAGGLVAASTAFEFTPENKPDFVIPVYADFAPGRVGKVLYDAPPLYLVCTQDDEFGFAAHAINLYTHWYSAKRPAELHLFSKGGHGFGIGMKGTTTHEWMKPLIGWLNNLHQTH
ncbi:MAG TPA: alpha/beta hydrolase [Chryseosolibacter sp.]